MSVASGSCLPCVEGHHAACQDAGTHPLYPDCPCRLRDHAPAGTDAPWCDADLAAMERDYARGGYDDVLALIRGVRAVLRLHAPVARVGWDGLWCLRCAETPYPCLDIHALNHPEESP